MIRLEVLLAGVMSLGLAVAQAEPPPHQSPTAKAGNRLLADCESQKWAAVESALAEGVEFKDAAPDGMTPLHWATWHGNAAIVAKMIEAGAKVDAETAYALTPLQIAAIHGRAEIVRELLDAGAEVDRRFPGGETPLMQAARVGDPKTVEYLLDRHADATATDKRGQTALMWAAAEGHHDLVFPLVRAGCRVDATLPSGFTALGFAAREGQLKAAAALREAGADIHAEMNPKSTAGRAPRKGMSPLMLAVESGHFEMAIQFVDWGADPNDQRSGFAPLHALSWVRKPNRGDNVDGDPPPRGSGAMGSLEFVDAIVQRGADVRLRLRRGRGGRARLSSKGATPLLMAAATADLPLVEKLVALGADIREPNDEGCTPLLAAAGVGVFVAGEYAGTEPEVLATVAYLHRQGADLDTIDDNGETALHGAAYRSFPRVVRQLGELGVDLDRLHHKNKLGSTPLQVAQGKRPGSFKPDPPTIEALQKLARARS